MNHLDAKEEKSRHSRMIGKIEFQNQKTKMFFTWIWNI